jgi:DNA-directed RNA polymerase subunit RPC12/RpoP
VSATILEFRRPLPRPQVTRKADGYVCSICFFDFFTLHEDGTINCAKCGIRMRNLFVENTDGHPRSYR